jgi:hypothetical protein
MSEKSTGRAKHDPDVYSKNRSRFLPQDLAPYADQWVAWSADGSRIVEHHADLVELLRRTDAAGIDREDMVLEQIPPGGVIETLL